MQEQHKIVRFWDFIVETQILLIHSRKKLFVEIFFDCHQIFDKPKIFEFFFFTFLLSIFVTVGENSDNYFGTLYWKKHEIYKNVIENFENFRSIQKSMTVTENFDNLFFSCWNIRFKNDNLKLFLI